MTAAFYMMENTLFLVYRLLENSGVLRTGTEHILKPMLRNQQPKFAWEESQKISKKHSGDQKNLESVKCNDKEGCKHHLICPI